MHRSALIGLVFALTLAGRPSAALAAPHGTIDLGPLARVLDTARCHADADAVAVARLPPGCFVPFARVPEPASLTYADQVDEWVVAPVPAAAADGTPWIVQLSWQIDRGEITFVGGGRALASAAVGSEVPVDRRAVHEYQDRIPVPAAIRPGDTIVLHVESQRAQFDQFELAPADTLAASDREDNQDFFTPLALLNGMLLSMAFFNVLLFLLLRQPSYLLYSLAMLAMVLFQTIQSGVAWTLLWPAWSVRDDAPAYVSYVVYFGLVTAFARSFLELPRVARWADRALLAAFVLLAIDAFFYVVLPGTLLRVGLWSIFDPFAVCVTVVALLAAGVQASRRGVKWARYYVIGFAGAAVGILLSEAADYGWIPAPVWHDLWSSIGVAWEGIFLAFALADRIRSAEREATRLTAFAYLDQLTGIANRRAFDEALDREWRRATRTLRPLSLLIFDIDHFKAYNDTNGHPAGDEALRLVATEIARAARRPGDFAARYGGEEFALILAETPRDGAFAAAESVREAVRALEVVYNGVLLTVSAGCATLVPADGDDASSLIAFADDALYAAKAAGRDRAVAAVEPVSSFQL
jgi:diguanylate cyclase (GGDEF)-like protein